MTPSLETDRLFLRPLAVEDAVQIQAIFPQWEVVRYLADRVPWPYPPDGALVFIRDVVLPAVARGEQWMWTLRLKTDPERVVGVIGLQTEVDNHRGFWIDPRYQMRGLMTEACETVTDYWFDTLGFAVLRVPKAVANVGSRRISEKQGMRCVATGHRNMVCGHVPVEVWEITAEEWRARRGCRGMSAAASVDRMDHRDDDRER